MCPQEPEAHLVLYVGGVGAARVVGLWRGVGNTTGQLFSECTLFSLHQNPLGILITDAEF
jgi:hypothetical protein